MTMTSRLLNVFLSVLSWSPFARPGSGVGGEVWPAWPSEEETRGLVEELDGGVKLFLVDLHGLAPDSLRWTLTYAPADVQVSLAARDLIRVQTGDWHLTAAGLAAIDWILAETSHPADPVWETLVSADLVGRHVELVGSGADSTLRPGSHAAAATSPER